MFMQLIREHIEDKSTEGNIFVNGEFECFSLEDKDRMLEDGGTKVYGSTCIPRGTYNVILTHSNRFKRLLPLLEDVPQFTGIRIHSGNTSEDTEGCILVGVTNLNDDDDFIGNSRVAFERLYSKIETAIENNEEVTIQIV